MILSLKSLEFSVSVKHISIIELIENQLGGRPKLPELELQVGFVSFTNDSLKINGILKLDKSVKIGNSFLRFNQVTAAVDIVDEKVGLALGGKAFLGSTELTLDSRVEGNQLILSGSAKDIELNTLFSELFGLSTSKATLLIEEATFSCSEGDEFTLEAKKIQFDFSQMAQSLNFRLPSGLANIEITRFKLAKKGTDLVIEIASDHVLPFADGVEAKGFNIRAAKSDGSEMTLGMEFELLGKSIALVKGCVLNVSLQCKGVINGDSEIAGKCQSGLLWW